MFGVISLMIFGYKDMLLSGKKKKMLFNTMEI